MKKSTLLQRSVVIAEPASEVPTTIFESFRGEEGGYLRGICLLNLCDAKEVLREAIVDAR